ncbi:MAG: pilus assembly protein TadG-related protein [Chloroflexota bacterium]
MPEKGQTIVILAAALIVLIGFVGLAVDLGYIWMRQTQLRTIVDAAALAGAPELGTSEGIVPADARAIQYLATNQIMETYGQIDLDQLTSFQSGQSRSTLGALEYTITVTWQVELFFMTVLGFDTVNITESSTAGYFPLVDLYAGLRVARNGVTTSTQAIFGPEQQTSFGDAFSNPSSPFLNQFNLVDGDTGDFRYQYRVEIPPGYKGFINTGSETGDSLLETNIVRIELLDPDSINRTMPDGTRFQYSRAWIDHLIEEGYSAETISEALSNSDCSDTRIYQPCVISTCEWSEDNCTREGFIGYNHNTNPFDETDINPFWYYRLDELRRPGGSTTSQEWGTATVYTLYYFQRMADGTIQRRNLASYVGQSGASNYASFNNQPIGTNHYSTDLKWVSPGAYNKIDGDVRLVPTRCEANMTNGGFLPAPGTCGETSGDEDATATQAADVNSWGRGFEVNIVTDLPGIVVDASSQMRYLYVDVKSIDGASENGFEIWAGPPYAHYVEGWQDVNQRNVLVTNEPNVYTTQGVSAYSVGIMPLNSLTNNRVDFPLVYVKPEFAGQNVEISLFDADSGVSYPLCFYFDTIPNPDCNSSYNNSGIDGYLVYYDEANDGNRCFPSCNNQFVTPSFTVQVPDFDQTSCNPNAATLDEKMFVCNEFLGGRLIVSYDGGQHDTYQWLVTFPSVPYLVR